MGGCWFGMWKGRFAEIKKAPRVAGHREVSVAPHKSRYLWGVCSCRIRSATSLSSRTRFLGTKILTCCKPSLALRSRKRAMRSDIVGSAALIPRFPIHRWWLRRYRRNLALYPTRQFLRHRESIPK